MIGCVEFYLQNGLIDYQRVNLDQKKLIEATTEEFVEFAEELQPDTWYARKEIYNKFLEIYPEYDNKTLQQKTFSSWIKIFARLNGYKLITKKSRNDRLFTFKILRGEEKNEDIIKHPLPP